MSYSYSRYDRQQRRSTSQRSNNTWTYWLPVGITVASAAVGLAIWAWNERRFSSDDEDDESSNSSSDPYAPPRHQTQSYDASVQQQASYASQSVDETQESIEVRDASQEQSEVQGSVFGRVSGAIRRTPSPQQLFDGASKRVAAGVAAAGAVMGKGLTALKETDEDFSDHKSWSDEAEKQDVAAPVARAVNAKETRSKKKRMVCVVVSAANKQGMEGMGSAIEHAVCTSCARDQGDMLTPVFSQFSLTCRRMSIPPRLT